MASTKTQHKGSLLSNILSSNGNNGKQKEEKLLEDYKLAVISREASYLGRKETLTGKAKFGIFGDGKEMPQIAMAKHFKEGDFRAGYYRDQTFMMAIGEITVQQFFAQLYAHANLEADPHSGGRQMNAHFSTRSLDEKGQWKDLSKMKNTSPDMSPTAGQMARLLGLGQASKVYRQSEELQKLEQFAKFSHKGNEIAWGTIGDSSTSEGIFWETVNAAGVLQIPIVLSVWDDGYGISVPRKYQTTKDSISEVLAGFQRTDEKPGWEILTVKAWDYNALMDVYEQAESIARQEHVPVLVHVQEVTQPQGHSTSGSHERYKSEERLQWEDDFCCIRKTRQWILDEGIADEETLLKIERAAQGEVKESQKAALKSFTDELKQDLNKATALLDELADECDQPAKIRRIKKQMEAPLIPLRRSTVQGVKRALRATRNEQSKSRSRLIAWLETFEKEIAERYHTHLYSESEQSPLLVEEVKPEYDRPPKKVDGRVLLRNNFDQLLHQHPELHFFGEDTGQLGDVNKGLEGMQKKYGELRVGDTGIREATILGQGIGMALRGLRPVAEIQYLDYILYCIQGLSDDLATIRYRSAGGQKAPVIVRTRGHRLEGIWHTGSPMGMLVNSLRGIHICVPHNLTEAAGMYNTLMKGDDPALVIEPLNAYRLKEALPTNLGKFTVPLGIPKVISEGNDITIVSYGSTLNVCYNVLADLKKANISVELIDVRTLLPFDRNHHIVESLKKTNRILFVDEDVPGGATAYMMRHVLDKQGGYYYLDSPAQCLTSKAHRTPYGSDGDYFTKPDKEEIFDKVYAIMHEAEPGQYPAIY